MISILSLWMPIVVSAVLVFIASSVIHMLLPYHKNDFRKLPDEEGVLDALGRFSIPPGDYVMPYAGSTEAMKSDTYRGKVERGPVAFMTVVEPSTVFNMTPSLIQWFLYSAFVGVFAAYVAGRTLTAGAEYLDVFRLTGTVAFACYAVGLMQRSIWYHQSWSTTGKTMFDGLIYAALTAGAFGWLWPS
ncbi:MAG: hypothetical protein WD995_04895 [Gemmatimonadota bacterium]